MEPQVPETLTNVARPVNEDNLVAALAAAQNPNKVCLGYEAFEEFLNTIGETRDYKRGMVPTGSTGTMFIGQHAVDIVLIDSDDAYVIDGPRLADA